MYTIVDIRDIRTGKTTNRIGTSSRTGLLLAMQAKLIEYSLKEKMFLRNGTSDELTDFWRATDTPFNYEQVNKHVCGARGFGLGPEDVCDACTSGPK